MPLSIVFPADGRVAHPLDWKGGGVLVMNLATPWLTGYIRTGRLAGRILPVSKG